MKDEAKSTRSWREPPSLCNVTKPQNLKKGSRLGSSRVGFSGDRYKLHLLQVSLHCG